MSYYDHIKCRLLDAVREGELDTVRELIDYCGLDAPDYSGPNLGYYSLRDAVENNQTEITELILTKVFKVNSCNKNLINKAIHLAVRDGNLEIVEMLLDRDADIEAKNNCGKTPLHSAINERNTEMIELLLNRGANVNAGNCICPLHMTPKRAHLVVVPHLSKYIPLNVATETGSEEIIKLLLSRNADVDSKGTNAITPLHIAAEKGYLQIVKILLQHGACVNSACSETWREGYTPMHFATKKGHTEIVKLLLSSNVDVEPKGTYSITPLHVAAEYGREEIAKLLLSNNAHIDSHTANDFTPLYIATKHGHEKVVKLFLEHGANVDAQEKDGRTVLQCAVKNGHYEIVKHILKCCPDVNNKSNKRSINVAVQGYGEQYKTILEILLQYGFTVNPEDVNDSDFLHASVEKGHFKIVEELLKSGADVHMLSNNNDSLLHTATKNKQEEIVTLLINSGANVNVDDKSGKPPIFYAIQNKDLKITKLLLTNGANVKDRPDLLIAAATKICKEIVEILLQYNADINAADENGLTALHFIVLSQENLESHILHFPNEWYQENFDNKEEVVRHLLSSGANVNAKTKKDASAELEEFFKYFRTTLEEYLEYIGDVNPIKGEVTPLHIAAEEANVIISKLLINNGANVNAKRQDGATSLHIATEFRNKEVVEVLLQSGAEVDSKTQRGMTPLHIAALNCDLEIVEILLKFGADIDCRDEHGETALHFASKAKGIQIVEVLLECGSDINIMNLKSNSTPLNLAMNACYDQFNMFFMLSTTCIEEIIEILQYHVIKLLTANLYVCDRNILSINNTDYFEIICEEEIDRMKSEKIVMNNNVSFHDILTKNTYLVAAYARNESLVQVLKSNDYKIKYPLYASMINCHFKKGLERKELLEQAFHIFPELPYDCTEKIFYYLSNKDIRMVIEACKPSNVSSPSTETS